MHLKEASLFRIFPPRKYADWVKNEKYYVTTTALSCHQNLLRQGPEL